MAKRQKRIVLPPQFKEKAPGMQAQSLARDSELRGSSAIDYLQDLFRTWDDARRTEIVPTWTRAWANFNSQPMVDGAINSYDTPVNEPSRGKKAWRSKAFHPLTEQKVMAGVSQLDDVLFRSDMFPYDLAVSPIPDEGLVGQLFDTPPDQVTPELQARMQKERLAKQKLRLMKLKIDDQLAECSAINEGRAVTFFAALYGTAAIEAPVVVRRTRNRYTETGKLKQTTEDAPAMRALDIWDCWPDPDCDGNVQAGRGFFHRQSMTLADLQSLHHDVFKKTRSGGTESFDFEYIKENFDALLSIIKEKRPSAAPGSEANPTPARAEDRPWMAKVSNTTKQDTHDLFRFAGRMPNDRLVGLIEGVEDDGGYTEVIIHFCEGHVIKASRNPFPLEERPFFLVPFTKVPGSCWGRGIPQKIFDYQENINRLIRMYIDNKRLSGNLMTAIDKSKLKNGETLDIYPGRNWEFDHGLGEMDVRKVIQSVALADVTGGVLEAVQMLMEWADQASGIPRILEGSEQAKTNATAYAENQRIIAASKQLGLALKNMDLYGWVPVIRAFYRWNMEFSKLDEIKGEYEVVATGFASFENKNLKKLDLERMMLMSTQNPILAARIKADPLVEDWFETSNLRVDRYLYSEEEAQVKSQQEQQAALEQQQATFNLQAAMEERKHAAEMEIVRAKADFAGMTRTQLEQMRAEAKLISDRMKIEAQKLIKSAELELGVRKLEREGERGKVTVERPGKPAGAGGRGKGGPQ